MKSIQEKIEAIKNNGYSLHFENTFEFALENYKKIAVYAGLMLLVFFIVLLFLSMGTVFYFYDLDTLFKNLILLNENPEAISQDFILGYNASIIICTCLISPFLAGFLKMADYGQKGKEFHVSTIFEYYKSPYVTKIVFATLLISLPGIALTILLNTGGLKFIGTLLSLLISFLTFLTIPLIVFGKLNALDSIKASCSIMSKKPFLLLGLLIVSGLFSIVGILGCGIGIVFTIPFMYSMTYAIYSLVVGLESEDKIENTQIPE